MCCVYTQDRVQLPHPPSTQSSVAWSWCSSTVTTQGLPATPFSFRWSRTHSQFPRPVPGTLGCSFVGLCVRNVRMHMQNCVCVRMYGHTCSNVRCVLPACIRFCIQPALVGINLLLLLQVVQITCALYRT